MDGSEAKRFFERTHQLYERHGKPLEAEHWGKYVAIHEDGRVIVDNYLDVLSQRARAELGESPILITRIGERGSGGAPKLLHPYGTPEQKEQMRRLQDLGDRLYEQYGKPMEAEHWGKYLAIHPNGRTVLAQDYETLHEQAKAEIGTGLHIFKIGPRATHSWNSFRRVNSGSQ